MEDQTEKRSSDRHFQEVAITVAHFNKNRYYGATMLNYGEGGLYFESDFEFQPGTCIYIRYEHKLAHAPEGKFHYGFRSVTLGAVKWCKEINNGESSIYGTGIRYYEHPY
jgi:hypothetical protein